jgi:hypothetical protein
MSDGDRIAFEEMREQATVLKAERDEARRDLQEAVDQGEKFATELADAQLALNKLARAFEGAMELVRDKLQLAYVSGWTAGRVEDDRVKLGADVAADTAMFMEAIASFRRFQEMEAKRVQEQIEAARAAREPKA